MAEPIGRGLPGSPAGLAFSQAGRQTARSILPLEQGRMSMPAGAADFKKYYQGLPDSQLLKMINDASNTGFFRSYRLWIESGRPSDDSHLVQAFHGFEPCRDALNAGDTQAGKTAGEVLSTDFDVLNAFVGHAPSRYSVKLLKSLGIKATRPRVDPIDEQIFEVALGKYFAKKWDTIQPYERAFVNGSIITLVDLAPTSLGSGTGDKRLFAIPGYLVGTWSQDPSDPFWRGVKEIVGDAFEQLGTRLVNLTGAVQLRLGDPDNKDDFAAIKVAPGFHIMGGM
jgi:hypothetical protein